MYKKRKKGISVLMLFLVLAVFVLPLSAAGKVEEKADEMVITYWHHEAPEHRVEAFDRVNKLFEAENPGVKMVQEVVMWEDAWTKSLSALQAGTTPDFQFSIPDLTISMYQADAIVPVTELINELDDAYSMFPNQKNMYYYDGEYWGIPIFTMIMTMTYRPELLQKYAGISEIPDNWDWNDVIKVAKKVTENGKGDVYGMGVGAARNLMTSEQIYVFLRGAGAEIFDEKGNVVFNNPRTVEALKMYAELFKYNPPGAIAWNWGEIESNIAAGTIAMSPFFQAVQKRLNDVFDTDDYAASHMPFFPGRTERGTLTYPNEIHIFKNTTKDAERYEMVKKFIRFIMRPDINAELTAKHEPGTFYPTTAAAAAAPEYWNDPIVKRFKGIHEVAMEALLGYATLYGFEYGEWVNLGIGDISGADVFAEVIHNVVSGQMTAEEAAAWGAREMEKYSIPVGK